MRVAPILLSLALFLPALLAVGVAWPPIRGSGEPSRRLIILTSAIGMTDWNRRPRPRRTATLVEESRDDVRAASAIGPPRSRKEPD